MKLREFNLFILIGVLITATLGYSQDSYEFALRKNENLNFEEEIKKSLFQGMSCEEFDITNEAPLIFRNQGETGFCWAYALSDLISYKMGVRVSAIDLALTYVNQNSVNRFVNKYLFLKDMLSIHSTKSSFLGGINYNFVRSSIQDLMSVGICLEDDFFYDYDNNPDIFLEIENMRESFLSKEGEAIFKKNIQTIQKLFPHITFTDLKLAAQSSQNYDFIHNIAMTSCRRVHFTHIPIHIENTPLESWKSIQKALLEKRPIVIANQYHARIIVGQKKINGICNVKIKDSAKGIYYQAIQKIVDLKLTMD